MSDSLIQHAFFIIRHELTTDLLQDRLINKYLDVTIGKISSQGKAFKGHDANIYKYNNK